MAGSISVLGVGSGLQLQDILDQLREADEAPIKRLETRKDTLDQQVTQFNQINQDLLDIKSVALNLSLESTYIARSVSSSDESVVTASVSDGANTGQHTITVNSLAKASSWLGTGVSSEDAVVNNTGGTETFSYHVGSSGDVISIDVPDQTTLSGLADLINNDENNPGVTARVINDGSSSNPYKLLLVADDTGESNRISIDSQLSGYTLTETVGAGGASLDAEIVVDDITYKRSSNSGINDILSGVTLNLVDTGSASVTVAADTDAVKEKILDLVEKVNTLLSHINEQTGYDENNEPKLLTSNSTVRSLPTMMLDLLSKKINVSGDVNTFYDLGFTVNRDGTLEIDEETLDSVIQNNYEDLERFMTGDTDNNIDGFATVINDTLRSWTNSSTGLMATEEQNASDSIDQIESQIEATRARLDRKYEILARRFAELDKFMNNMQSMSDYLTQQFDAISGNKK